MLTWLAQDEYGDLIALLFLAAVLGAGIIIGLLLGLGEQAREIVEREHRKAIVARLVDGDRR